MKELSTLDTIVTYALTPLSWVYGAVTTLRNKLFDIGLLKEMKYDVPVISIGNITVGGTGKTPHVELLVSKLCFDFNIGVISRGYKRKTRGFILANSKSTPNSIGDEPYQIYQKFGHRVKVAVSESRRKGIQKLMELHPEVNLIILDDAFQHRYVKPFISVILVDYNRPIWEDHLLPLGRLRENAHGTDRADIIIVTKCPTEINPIECRIIDKGLDLLAFQKHYLSTYSYDPLRPVFPDDRPYDVSLESFTARDSVLLLTGIAHPRSFVRYFKRFPFKVKVNHFPDHHDFDRSDLQRIARTFAEMKGAHKIIVTTEKDAVRLLNNPYFPEEMKPLTYFLPVRVDMLDGKGDGSFIRDIRQRLGLPEKDDDETIDDVRPGLTSRFAMEGSEPEPEEQEPEQDPESGVWPESSPYAGYRPSFSRFPTPADHEPKVVEETEESVLPSESQPEPEEAANSKADYMRPASRRGRVFEGDSDLFEEEDFNR